MLRTILATIATLFSATQAVELEQAQRQNFQLEAGITFPDTIEVGDLGLHFIANADASQVQPIEA